MNNRDRRKMSHKLGIMQFQQKLPRHKKWEIIRENIISGKKREQEVAEEVRRQQSLSEEERESEAIELLSNQIAQQEKIPLIDAREKVIKMFKKRSKI
jgi:hypothetical protein